MTQILNNQPPIACNLEAMSDSERQRHHELRGAIEANMAAVEETLEGLTFRFASDSKMILQLAEFITLERLCCPFLHFSLEVEPNGGPLYLRLMGGQGDKSLSGLIPIADLD